MFGSGAVRGFAVTLAIGLITSMFSAIMLTRIMVVLWLRKRRPDTLPL
jgi:preprotein translocase subunit SecD